MTTYQKLSDVLQFIRGVTFSPEELVTGDEPGAIACLRTKNIQKELDDSDLIYVPASVVKREEQALQEGDLLISSANSWELVGKTVRVGKLSYPATAGGFISILRPDRERIDPDYLFRFISWERTQHEIRHLGRQTTNISNLDRERFLELPIPLPLLATQRHIAQVLEQADCLRRQAQQMGAELDRLAQALFLEMFGDPIENPMGWPTITIGEISSEKDEIVDGPFGSSLKPDCYVGSGVRVIRNYNIKPGWFDESEYKYVKKDKFEKLKRSNVRPGDILISTKGTVGNFCVFPDLAGDSVLSASGTVRWRMRNPGFDKDFIVFQANFKSFRGHIDRVSSGAVQKYLNLSGIRGLTMISPPLEMQKTFKGRLNSIRTQIAVTKQVSSQQQALFNSLMQRAFKGELTPKLA